MSILDLIKKYESNDSIEYLRKVFGSDDYINDMYEETCFIGYSNLDNHYKKVNYVR